MSKVIGIGETVTDIIIRDNKPQDMVCGGSCFNSMISLGRSGVESVFMGEVGDDRLGEQTISFLRHNGVCADYVCKTTGKQSQLSLAFLDEQYNAQYVFYKDHSTDIFPQKAPNVHTDDVVIYGSFFALNPIVHEDLSRFIKQARSNGAMVYYDINFRANHCADRERISNELLDNLRSADIVKGSDEDFFNIFATQNIGEIWERISPFCRVAIVTRGPKNLSVVCDGQIRDYEVPKVEVVSTVGAGDSFNAGFIYGLIKDKVSNEMLYSMPQKRWDALVEMALRFSGEVCATTNNYISRQTGLMLQQELQTQI